MAYGSDLEHHHAHGMRDHVVQARVRSARAPRRDGDAGRRRRSRSARAARSSASSACAALAQREAGEPADEEHRRDDDELACGVNRVVVHENRRRTEHDNEPRPSLRSVGQVAKQKCRNQTGDCRGIRERDQTSIDEREHHRHHPSWLVRRRENGAVRVAATR